MSAGIMHSHVTHRWGTPDTDDFPMVSLCRELMGGVIDLDPASESVFNEVVKATRYYSSPERGEDGLVLPWYGRVLLNPPGEEKGKPRQNFIPRFWRKAITEDIEQCCYVGFAMDQLNILANEEAHPTDFSIVYLRNRLPFRRHDWVPGMKDAPAKANFIVGLNVDHKKFVELFSPYGKVQAGPLARDA